MGPYPWIFIPSCQSIIFSSFSELLKILDQQSYSKFYKNSNCNRLYLIIWMRFQPNKFFNSIYWHVSSHISKPWRYFLYSKEEVWTDQLFLFYEAVNVSWSGFLLTQLSALQQTGSMSKQKGVSTLPFNGSMQRSLKF